MAIIRNNTVLTNLQTELSNAIANGLNTTTIVNILNGALGAGEQIGQTAFNTITEGVYKKFGVGDQVLNRTEIVGSFCSGGCRYLIRRYYWNAPLCQPNPCSPCTCPAYDDANELSCCACFGCY